MIVSALKHHFPEEIGLICHDYIAVSPDMVSKQKHQCLSNLVRNFRRKRAQKLFRLIVMRRVLNALAVMF